MKIVTTPMCEKILKLAGIKNYIVSKNPDETDADIAVVLYETNTKKKAIKLKLNTFDQIEKSISKVRDLLGGKNKKIKINFRWADENYRKVQRRKNRKIKVKVYSNFLKDIVKDMGYKIVNKNPDFIIYPDYMEDKIKEENVSKVKVPSHENVPKDPIERAKVRYNLLEKKLCMKH